MAITPQKGYKVDPNNPNGVVPIDYVAPVTDTAPLPGIQFQPNTTTPGGGGTAPISISGLQTPQTPVPIPTQPPVDTGASANASIPTPEAIVNAATAPTATDNQESSFLQRIAKLTGENTSLATRQTQAEIDAGVPALASAQNDLAAQLEGLNNQALALQNEAQYTIPNAAQVASEGRGITAGGLAPITASQLRMNQIKQGAIATQALTVKSALYAAQGKYSLAKDAADKAAQVAFDAKNQEIAHQQALLAAIAPTLNREEKARALILQAKLDDRQTQIKNQQDDFKAGQGFAFLAMQNNPNDPTAQFNAQQALKLDPNDPQYLQKVMALVGKYQKDPMAVEKQVLDLQNQRLQNQKLQADINKVNADIEASKPIDMSKIAVGGSPEEKNAAVLSTLLKSSKVGQGTKTQVANILSVINALGDVANANSDTTKPIKGVNPFNTILNATVPFTEIGIVPYRQTFKGKESIENEQYVNAINLKVQQWASGAALTTKQTEQVAKLTPTVTDTDENFRTKVNGLANFMLTQTKSQLQSEGIDFTPEKVDLFDGSQIQITD